MLCCGKTAEGKEPKKKAGSTLCVVLTDKYCTVGLVDNIIKLLTCNYKNFSTPLKGTLHYFWKWAHFPTPQLGLVLSSILFRHRPNCLDTIEYRKMSCRSVPNFDTKGVNLINVSKTISLQHWDFSICHLTKWGHTWTSRPCRHTWTTYPKLLWEPLHEHFTVWFE